ETPTLAIAAARLLTDVPEVRAGKTAAPLQALLAYLPFADNDAIEEEVLASMCLLCVRRPDVESALSQALGDKEPQRRGAAAFVLGRAGTEEQRKQVRKLLADPVLKVRLSAAQGLLAGRDREAVPALIGLLKSVPRGWLWKVEEQLLRLAGADAPSPLVS